MGKKSRKGSLVPFSDGKLWFRLEGDMLTLGLTIETVDEIGDVVSVELPEEDDDFDKDDAVCEVHGADGNIKVYTPAAGIVKKINDALQSAPTIVSEDPTDEGWLVELEIQDDSDLKEYL